MSVPGYFENPWAFWLLIPFLLAVLFEFYFRRQPFWVLLPRLIWLSGVVLLIANYNLIMSREFSEASLVRVFIDQSDSVTKVEDRAGRAREFFEEMQAWAAQEQQPIEFYSFAEDILPVAGGDLSGPLLSERTSLAGLSDLPLSDGTNVILSDGNFSEIKTPREKTFTIQVGEDSEKDIWIESAPAVVTAFLKNRVQFEVQIGHKGFDSERLRLNLKRGAEIVEEKEIQLSSDLVTVEMSYFPERMGEELFELELLGSNDEITQINNRTYFRLRTVRDKIRVLHISGKPSQDLKAWRMFLTRQPDVDLVSFYILRSLDDDPMAKNTELSLIPFPYEELFTTELEKFDVVILQNFNFNLYFQPFYLRNLARFIEAGGALLMMGGDQSFQHYRASPLQPLFPFQYGSGEYQGGSFQAKVHRQHPIIEDLAWIFERPSWSTRHSMESLPTATDLIRFQDGTPLLSFREVGEGRILIVNTDESWRFQFQRLGDYIPFNRFARRTLQFLTFDPEMEAKRLISSEWNVGENVILKTSNQEISDWEISLGQQVWKFSNQKELRWKVPEAGLYEVRLSSLSDTFRFETEQKPWRNEWKSILSRSDSLRKISESSGGRYLSWDDRKNVLDESLSGRQIISASTESWVDRASGLSWLILLATIFFLCLDFFLRKKHQWDA